MARLNGKLAILNWLMTLSHAHCITTRMAVVGFTRAPANEPDAHNITVNAIATGLVAIPPWKVLSFWECMKPSQLSEPFIVDSGINKN